MSVGVDLWTAPEIAQAVARHWEGLARQAAQSSASRENNPVEAAALRAVGAALESLDHAEAWLGVPIAIAPMARLASLPSKSAWSSERFERALGRDMGEREYAREMATLGPDDFLGAKSKDPHAVDELLLRAGVAARRWAFMCRGDGAEQAKVRACQGALASLARLIAGVEGRPGLGLAPDPESAKAASGARAFPQLPAAMREARLSAPLSSRWTFASSSKTAMGAWRLALSLQEAAEIERALLNPQETPKETRRDAPKAPR